MLTTQRRALISARLSRDGEIVAKRLADELDLSEDTIRRDLREMAAEGLLKRVHGGALPLVPPLPDFAARQAIAGDVKRRLGRKAASMIEAGQTIFLDGGTSNAEVARALPRQTRLTVVTHSPTIAAELERHEAEVILIGGRLYKHSMVATGAAALAAIAGIRVDLFFLGVTAIHPAHGASTGDYEEAAVKRAILKQAADIYVLATSEKFGAVSPHRVADISDLSGFIVPEEIGDEMLAPYQNTNITIITA
ncbi:DeoR/GlpR family DNA-binding transcription regulator [Ensifer adhaerens]|uniref:DeoR/GlpR family DNA-binding transcription regulator n=1 Tax=Ensifer adhaerens TaxID=106592 RepID=UPI001CBD6FBB|nr:DeoR/GlpR family DNA-binding transcription regulator [Ensifer adhaerens]MBZ7920804.1 DeoR/GlpR family DNA-binding transcription regulator [Ensifer adhaerens]UAX93260.1 DeoR/GlpR family DNA-binding transcription regulator [Ensifer adhaerens]UAY00897.1 DeoR/GlpR family DNA-binding transcription regulator [Ensifer adhaerens]UAY08278.1 DeoR/GlpR family DNA-binding transcription regulator [Ensifer adhaerens]